MIYEYECWTCEKYFDVVKPVADYKRDEKCPKCDTTGKRVPFPRKMHLVGTKVQERYFNHALGRVCTDSEAKQIAKEKGMIEVGNEDVPKHVALPETNYDDVWKGA